jgi:O-antigen chain-terminating methyltransferase
MIESNNLEINVDELMQKVRAEVASRHKLSLGENVQLRGLSEINYTNDSHIETLLSEAEFFSQVPTELPDKFQRFPFNFSNGLQKFVLKLYGFLFKKQRVVNFSLIQAHKESVNLNRQLMEQVTALQFQLREMGEHLKATDERLNVTNEHHSRNESYLKNELAQQQRLIARFLEEARQRLPQPFSQEQLQSFANEEQHLLDGYYSSFEEQFRGSREQILDSLKVYLPLLEKAKVGTPECPILDIGCGRGEWLELLRESGYTARGLDLNQAMIDSCRARGLEVLEGEVIDYLRTLPDLSLGAVTGFHIIEHLSFTQLQKLINEVIRVLKPGGLALFETPNPKNLVVGACNFYADPTHRNPLFPDTVQFLVESQGLSNVQILYLHPVEGSPFDKEDAGSQLLHTWFFCSRDYAVVGYKV